MQLEKSNIGFVQKSKDILFKIRNQYKYKIDFIDKHLNRIDSLCNEPLNLAVMGEFNAGKSSFINKLLDIDILPTGIVPKTATIIKVKYSKEPHIEIYYKKNGKTVVEKSDDFQKIKLFQKAKDINNNEIAADIKSVKEIIIYLDNKLLKNFTFIDTPGFNHNSKMDEITRSIFNQVDIVIWLITKNQAIKKTEVSELTNLKKYVDNIMLVVNKSDINTQERDEKEIIDTIREKFDGIISNQEIIYFISSKQNLDEKQEIKFQNFVHELKRNALEDDVRISEELLKKEFRTFKEDMENNLIEWKNMDVQLSDILYKPKTFLYSDQTKLKIKATLKDQLKKLIKDIDQINSKYKSINTFAKEYIADEFYHQKIKEELSFIHSNAITKFMEETFEEIESVLSANQLAKFSEKDDILAALNILKAGLIKEAFDPLTILGFIKFYINNILLNRSSLNKIFSSEINENMLENILLGYDDDLNRTTDMITENKYISSKIEKLLESSRKIIMQIENIQNILGEIDDYLNT